MEKTTTKEYLHRIKLIDWCHENPNGSMLIIVNKDNTTGPAFSFNTFEEFFNACKNKKYDYNFDKLFVYKHKMELLNDSGKPDSIMYTIFTSTYSYI